MSKTGFVCPKCGSDERFTVDRVLLFTEVLVTEDGWDYTYDKHADCELPDSAVIACCKCGNEGNWHVFEEGYC